MTHLLTPRKAEIAVLVAEGLQNAEIAEVLACSVHTVHAHIRAIALRLPGRGNLRVRIATWAAQHAA